MSEPDTYPRPAHGWTCFHCGETFKTPGSARDHFGFEPSDDPGCRVKIGAERGLLMALRRAEKDAADAWAMIAHESAQALLAYARQSHRHETQLMAAEEAGYEKGLAAAADALQSSLAEEERLRAALNTPETHDFAKGVALEAAHQRQRWGSDHDAGKEPEDWFWLLGWLGGKAARAAREGDREKALHHCISSAAVLANWHAAILGANRVMRPGIDPQERGYEFAALAPQKTDAGQ